MSLNKKVKGFTLVELIIVIAIIAILAGIGSISVQSYVRNARLEALNDRAQLVFTAFQDILLDCEVNQDNSIFEPRGEDGALRDDDVTGAIIFFRISQYDRSGHANVNGATGLGDEIHIMTTHRNDVKGPGGSDFSYGAGPNRCSISVWAEGSTNPGVTSGSGANNYTGHGSSYWKKLNGYISGRLDESAAGSYYVSVDLENYQVLSVICRDIPADGKDPKTGLYDASEVADSSKALGKFINYYSDEDGHTLTSGGLVIKPQQRTYIVKNKEHQKAISSRVGVDIGAYPYGDDIYTNVTKPNTV